MYTIWEDAPSKPTYVPPSDWLQRFVQQFITVVFRGYKF